MRVRKDMKNSHLFNETVKKYRKKLRTDFIIMSIISFIFIAIIGYIGVSIEEGFTFFNFVVSLGCYFVLELCFILVVIYRYIIPCRVVEIEVQRKEELGTDEDTIYRVREYKKWYIVEDWETYSRIQEGNVYYFLCRGKKIVDIVSKESFY